MWRQKSSAFVVIHRYYKNHHHILVVVVIKLTIIVTKSASTTSTPPSKTILPPSLLIVAAKHHSLPYIRISFWKNPPLKKVFSLAKISKERERELVWWDLRSVEWVNSVLPHTVFVSFVSPTNKHYFVHLWADAAKRTTDTTVIIHLPAWSSPAYLLEFYTRYRMWTTHFSGLMTPSIRTVMFISRWVYFYNIKYKHILFIYSSTASSLALPWETAS